MVYIWDCLIKFYTVHQHTLATRVGCINWVWWALKTILLITGSYPNRDSAVVLGTSLGRHDQYFYTCHVLYTPVTGCTCVVNIQWIAKGGAAGSMVENLCTIQHYPWTEVWCSDIDVLVYVCALHFKATYVHNWSSMGLGKYAPAPRRHWYWHSYWDMCTQGFHIPRILCV